jgi:hypothetical protein
MRSVCALMLDQQFGGPTGIVIQEGESGAGFVVRALGILPFVSALRDIALE